MKERLRQQIQRYSEGKLSVRQQLELSEQLSNEQNSIAEEILHEDWQTELESDAVIVHNLNPLLDKIHHKIALDSNRKQQKFSWRMTFQRIAAILIIPFALSFLAYYFIQNKQTTTQPSYAEIVCPLGVRTKFYLPDGSTGYLNSGSSLKYSVQFTKERKVKLSGEAYFDIVHNPEVPFHVNTANLDIKVLGTTFDVIANDDETTEEIILQTGRVDVRTKTGVQLALLKPNEQLILDLEKHNFSKFEVEAAQYTTWKEGKLVFRNENMKQMARRLSRWYNAEVSVDDHMLNDYSFHATFIDEPLDEVLKLLSITTPLNYKEERRMSTSDGVFQKRKINLRIDHSKLSKFK